jgi:hypothetical protein
MEAEPGSVLPRYGLSRELRKLPILRHNAPEPMRAA